jgi:hypothetical protein
MDAIRKTRGAISSLAGLRYWSTTNHQWQTLIEEAYAVTGAKSPRRRADFAADEVKTGATLYFEQADNLSGRALFRIDVREASADRLVFEVANATSMKYLLVTLFPAEAMRSLYYLERDGEHGWKYYAITRTAKGASRMTVGHDASWINRSAAYYRHLAGIPADREPPAAR